MEPVVYGHSIRTDSLWQHQQDELQRAREPAWFLLWEPRVGKTREVLAQARVWFNEIDRLLVVAPQTVCGMVWEPEVKLAFPKYEDKRSVKTVSLFSGSIKDRLAILRSLVWRKENSPEPVAIIVNRDALHDLSKELQKWAPQAMILDECHDFKTPSSLRHLAAAKLARTCKFVRGLTGTPTPRSYGDIYGQWKIIAPNIFGTSKTSFEAEYIVTDQRFHNRIIAYKNVEQLRSKAFAIASIKRRSECFDIPQVQEIIRKITLPDKAKKLYDQIAQKHIAELEDGKLLSLDHTLARLTALAQLAGGAQPDKDGWLHDALIDAAIEEIEDIVANDKKVVVFHRFIAEGKRLHERLGYNKAARIDGSTKSEERTRLIEAFQKPWAEGSEPSKPQVIIMQESVGSVGISLAAADYCIFLSCGFSYATHTQARDRIFKPGGKLVYIYLLAKGTVHVWNMSLIRSKQNASEALLKGTDFKKIAFGEE